MKKLVLCLFSAALVSGAAMAQPPAPPKPPGLPPKTAEKRTPGDELHAQGNHVKSSGDDLLHLRFKKAHRKHVAEAKRRNRGIKKDANYIGVKTPPPPPKPNL